MEGIDTLLRYISWGLVIIGPILLVSQLTRGNESTSDAGGGHGGRPRGDGAGGPGAAHEHRLLRRRAEPGPAQGARAGAPRRRGPGPRRRRLPRQDRDPDRRRDHLRGDGVRRGRWTRTGPPWPWRPSPTTRTRTRPSRHWPRPSRRRRHGCGPHRCRSRRPASGAAPTFDGHGSWVMGAPEIVLGACPRRPRGPLPGRRALGRGPAGAPGRPTPRPRSRARRCPRVWRPSPSSRSRSRSARTPRRRCGTSSRRASASRSSRATTRGPSAAVAERVGVPDVGDAGRRPHPAATTPPSWRLAVNVTTVFGRVTPNQKRAFVHALQQTGPRRRHDR